jgi:hypothetical protein
MLRKNNTMILSFCYHTVQAISTSSLTTCWLYEYLTVHHLPFLFHPSDTTFSVSTNIHPTPPPFSLLPYNRALRQTTQHDDRNTKLAATLSASLQGTSNRLPYFLQNSITISHRSAVAMSDTDAVGMQVQTEQLMDEMAVIGTPRRGRAGQTRRSC